METLNTDVLIVGAGPTGLALATALQKSGVDHLIIDGLPAGTNTSRAAVIHAHTLEMLEPLGVVQELEAEGLTLGRFTLRDRDTPLIQLSFDELPSTYQHILMIPQPRTEAVLAGRLQELGGAVRREVKAVSAAQSADHVLVQTVTPEGDQQIRARFVVGADGMHSTIRQSTSIEFQGQAYGESFVLADVRMNWRLGQTEVSLSFSPAGLVVIAPLPDGTFRIVATMDDAPEAPAIEDIQRLLDERGPKNSPARVHEIVWGSRFRVHHRLASTYREGRILLMGDAAHVHSPAGGQGMNAGLVDAMVLSQALTAIVRDGASVDSLNQYARLRRPAASEVLGLASRLTKMATVRPILLRKFRNVALRLLGRLPAFRRKLALQLSGIGRRHLSALDLRSDLASETIRGARESGTQDVTVPPMAA
jgi:2-polyprenyl-6-methoxyphenol hydroxylase-like FAD-dependent oxidoreductase